MAKASRKHFGAGAHGKGDGSWAMMLAGFAGLGFAGLGFAGYRASRKGVAAIV